jgi:Pectate lyase superfamily protein
MAAIRENGGVIELLDSDDNLYQTFTKTHAFTPQNFSPKAGSGGDDTAAIQNAIDTAGSTAGGGVVYLPTGSYAVTNLVAPANGNPVRIIGDGPQKTFLGARPGSTGILLDLTYTGSAQPNIEVSDLSIHLTNAKTMTALRTQNITRLRVSNLNFRYGTIGWEHVMLAGTGPFIADSLNFQNISGEAIHLTGSSGVGSAGAISRCFITITDSAITATQGILIDWFTTGVVFDKIQILGNVSSGLNIGSGIVYNTAVPSGLQGAFLFFTNCVTDQMNTGHGLDLTNARGIQSTGNFWSVNPGTGKAGVNINAGKQQRYANDWISGIGINFSNAPDQISVGSGCTFPQTSSGGALVMGASPPTNVVLAPDLSFLTSITNDVAKLDAATNRAWSWGRPGASQGVYKPSGVVLENFDYRQVNGAAGAMADGTLLLVAIDLPLGLIVTNIEWLSGTTALINGGAPHYWVALFDKNRALLAQSTDNVTKAIGTSALITDALSVPFTTTYAGLHYIGVMVASGGGTQPTMTNFGSLTAIMGLNNVDAGKTNGTSTTGLTTTAPATAAAITQTNTILWAGVS